MKKLSVSLIALIFATPAFATGIDAGETSASCDNGVLGTYEGSSNLQAQWTANRITLNWYDDSTENGGQTISVSSASNACTYDGGITLPNDPEKTGYEFSGWKVRRAAAAPQQTSFDLSTLNASTNGIYYASKSPSGTNCVYRNYDTNDNMGGSLCDRSIFSDLSAGEWKSGFSYGTVKGIAYCSGKSGDNHSEQWGGNSADWSATESELTNASEGARYCWCKPIWFDAYGDGAYLNVSSSSWVFERAYYSMAANCESNCAYGCARNMAEKESFRSAVFGVNQ